MHQAPGRSASAAVIAVSGVLLLVVLSTWAASIGPGGLFRDDGIEPVRVTPTASPTEATDTATVTDDEIPTRSDAGDLGWVRILAVLLQLALAGFVLYLFFRASRWAVLAWRDRERPPPREVEVEFDVLEGPQMLATELARDAAAQRELLLTEGSPRNAIVRCWHEFEVSAARVGLARKAWQTPAEFTLQVLDLVEADHGAVARLADRYREARFSEHDVSEADRAEALAALDEIHAGLSSHAGRRR